MKCLIYARFSTAEQAKGLSIERQVENGRKFAENNGWTVEAVIIDEGRSAYHARNRSEGSALHGFEVEARANLHRGKTLVVENADRLSRQGIKAAASLIWGLNNSGVNVATYHDGHIYQAEGAGSMQDVFTLARDADLAYWESHKKSGWATATWQKRHALIRSGTLPPLPHLPHWIKRDGDQLLLIPERVALINEIYDLYLDGVGIHRIVTMLNDRKEPRWSDKATNGWFYSYVYRLLTKRSIIGDYVDEIGQVLGPGIFPSAVSRAKWSAVQAALKLRKSNTKPRSQGSKNVLAHLIVCAECGGGAHFRHATDNGQRYMKKNGDVVVYRRKEHRRLRCDRNRRRHQCRNDVILDYDVVEVTLLDEMLPRLVDQPSNSRTAVLRQRVADIETIIVQTTDEIRNLVNALSKNEASDAPRAVLERITELEASKQKQHRELTAAQIALDKEEASPKTTDTVVAIERLRASLNDADPEVAFAARRKVNIGLRRLIDRISLNANGTFTVHLDQASAWTFDEKGTLLEGYWS